MKYLYVNATLQVCRNNQINWIEKTWKFVRTNFEKFVFFELRNRVDAEKEAGLTRAKKLPAQIKIDILMMCI